jgi:cysteine-rich repeat protein
MVEIGYSCSGGSQFSADTCSEICGDGLKLGLLLCDDGNLRNNDGCNSQCIIEAGWACGEGDSRTADICWPIELPHIVNSSICEDGSQLII